MRLAITGSIATDHLMTFEGKFVDSVLPDQLAHLSLSFLASDLQVRRGGTGANIAFGLGVLGLQPTLIGSVGQDADDYLAWLTRHGVDVAGVLRSPKLATARFTCTTDDDLNQIATFYPGAMTEAAGIELAAVGTFDLVLIAPNDPGAMARHTTECRHRGIPFAADPSQQLAFLDGAAISALVEGAAWLFSNEYEAGLIREKTGWSDAEVLS
ncbi:MAG: adoK, partial [Frankiales bacterium]|nr:adoK [Frankiales bacterium]